MRSEHRIRILQVVGGMNVGGRNRGGVQTWLMNVYRHINRDRFRFDFLVHTKEKCADEDEIVPLGGTVVPCELTGNTRAYGRRLRRILRECSYDVVHSHVLHFSGYVLKQAAKENIPVRIAHSHLTRDTQGSTPLRIAYRYLTRRWIRRYSTTRLACGREAAAYLFGNGWRADDNSRVLYCGVDLAEFERKVDRAAIMARIGLPENCKVVGHVGRLSPQKNHSFLIEIAAEVVKARPDVYFLLVGDGPLRTEVQAMIRTSRLEDRVLLLGARSDVPDLMQGVFDLFVLPSHYEGLPITLLEAQAAGLPGIVSDQVTSETDVLPELIERLSLKASPAAWAERILQRLEPGRGDRARALEAVRSSQFTIEASVKALEQVYSG